MHLGLMYEESVLTISRSALPQMRFLNGVSDHAQSHGPAAHGQIKRRLSGRFNLPRPIPCVLCPWTRVVSPRPLDLLGA